MLGDILKIIVETTGTYLSKKAGEAVKRAIDDRKKKTEKKKR
ncbi:MAG: hypothetical protein ABIK61_02215 [candidate division WOR-3 bacterium]